jgi:hypothetical protein
MEFEWNESKNHLNIQKHGISFELAQCALLYVKTKSGFLAQELGAKEGEYMRARIKYENALSRVGKAIEQSKIIGDFLPPPDKLVLKGKTRKITINLSEESLVFFKETAKQFNVSYQQMIKELLDKYTTHYKVRQK